MSEDFYRAIALCYDDLGNHLDFADYADTVVNAIKEYSTCDNKIALDLACGTGSLSIELSKRGFDVIGSDSCVDMLSIARAKAERENQKILFIEQDMRSSDLFGTVGLIVCATDSLNHLLTKDDLERCIRTATKFLESGGLFVFDINTKEYFERVCADRDWIMECENALCCVSCDYPATASGTFCDYYMSLFSKNESGLYQRTDSYQRERIWSKKVIENILSSCDTKVLSLIPFENSQSGRLLFICKKN